MKIPVLSSRRAAFSLIELIVVISIIAIIVTFSVPAVTGILRGSTMTQGSQILTDQISFARQRALSRNLPVEVRFYQYADPEAPGEKLTDPTTGQWRGMQLFEVVESGVAVPIDKLQQFPGTVIITSRFTFSSIISGTGQTIKAAAASDPELPRGIGRNYKYASFRFLQDGSTNLAPTGSWFVTIHNVSDQPSGTTPPINFFTLQIDPVSGSVKGFRPTAG